MSDIHILDGVRSGRNRISKRCAFHFLIAVSDQVAAAAQDPVLAAFESAVPDILAGELTAIQAGEVVELVVSVLYGKDAPLTNSLNKAKAKYLAMEPKVAESYVHRYRAYLTTHSAT